MLNRSNYILRAKKEAANYLKMTASMGIIRSRICLQLSQKLLMLQDNDNAGIINLLKTYSTKEASPKPLKGCHRHFFEKLKMLYKQIKYDRELQRVINQQSSNDNEEAAA